MPSFRYSHKEGNVALSKVGLHYLEWGDSGRDVLIVHGITGMAIRWQGFAQSLMDDFHVIAIDLRGHGHSSWADSYTLDDYAADIDEFIERVGIETPVLVGHSLGGAISMRFLGTRRTVVGKFVCVDMGPELPRERLDARRERPDAPREWQDFGEALEFVKSVLPAPKNEDAQEYLFNHLRWSRNGKLEARHDPLVLGQVAGASGAPWVLWDEIRRISAPTLVVRGENSRVLTREIANRMVGEIGNARLAEIPGAGHVLNVEAPEVFNRVVGEFMRQ